MTEEQIKALAAKHFDVDVDSRGREEYSCDDHGLIAFARRLLADQAEREAKLRAELAHEEQRVADMMADVNRVGHENDALRAEVEALRAALHTCLWAMRQPLDDWKGDCERKAMDKANAALAQAKDAT